MASKRPQSAMSAEGTSGHDTPLGSQGSSASASSSVVVVKKEEPSDENENGPPSSKKTAVIPPVSIGKDLWVLCSLCRNLCSFLVSVYCGGEKTVIDSYYCLCTKKITALCILWVNFLSLADICFET